MRIATSLSRSTASDMTCRAESRLVGRVGVDPAGQMLGVVGLGGIGAHNCAQGECCVGHVGSLLRPMAQE
jgi:hypothetical protein